MKHTPQQSSHDIQDRQLSPRPIYDLVVICLASILTCDYAVCETRQSGIGPTELEVLREGLVKWSMALKSFAGSFTVTQHAILPRSRALIAGLVVLICPGIFAEQDLVIIPGAEELRTLVLRWSTSVHSLCAQYLMTQYSMKDSNRSSDNPFLCEVEYCFQGRDHFIRVSEVSEAGAPATYRALFDGEFSWRTDVRDAEALKITGGIGKEGVDDLGFPHGAYLEPEVLFGKLQGFASLAEFLASGQSDVISLEGRRALSHRGSKYYRLDIFLDEEGRVVQLDRCLRGKDPGLIAEAIGKDAASVRWVEETFEYLDYVKIADCWFPTAIRSVVWAPNEPEVNALLAARDNGDITDLDYFVKVCTQVQFEEQVIRFVNFDQTTLRINEELSDEDFEISFPANAKVFGPNGDRVYPVGRRWRDYLSAYGPLLSLSSVVGVLLLVALIRQRRLQPSHYR